MATRFFTRVVSTDVDYAGVCKDDKRHSSSRYALLCVHSNQAASIGVSAPSHCHIVSMRSHSRRGRRTKNGALESRVSCGRPVVNSVIGVGLACPSLTGVRSCCRFSRFTRSQPNAAIDCALNLKPCSNTIQEWRLVSQITSSLSKQSRFHRWQTPSPTFL